MSTPTNNPNARPASGPNGAPMKMRRPKAADPLVRPKRKPAPKPGAATPSGNGTASKPPSTRPPRSSTPLSRSHAEKTIPTPAENSLAVNGFSGPLLTPNYVDYPLVITKRELREGLKHHIARFASKKHIDPRDEAQFTRPVRLQRRDPRAKSQEIYEGRDQGMQNTGSDSGLPMDEAERENFEARREARDRERADNLAQIAPSVASGPKRSHVPKQKTQHVSKSDMTPEEVAKTKLRYEEALPWYVEDFDNRNTWVGNYEAALSETHAAFVLENTGKMRMIPVEKWYKFTAKSQFKPLSIEEAEKFMAKKVKDPRWFMEKQQEFAQQKELESFAKQRRVFAGKQGTPAGGGDGLGGDEMDFEEDRFADDEEHDDLFNDDEDTKVAEKRIKQDQLKANVFDLKDEKEYENEEVKEKKEKEAQRVLGKKVRKALQKREKNYDYSSGSDVNPYSDESSDESEAEEQKDEEKKTEEEKNRKESGTSSKDHGTPSGRQKHTDALKKGAAAPRKRPGSPNVSDASGTDTSRKKTKSKHPSSQPTPQPGSRPMSPAPSIQPGKKRVRNVRGSGGPGSDIDAGAGSAGEMSESGKPKKLKLNPPGVSSPSGTPQGSRAGSPTPLSSRGISGSRASSPEQGSSTAGALPPGSQSFPSPAEIHASIPATGILSSDLLKKFRPRIGDSRENHRRFIAIVKDVGVYGKEDRLLRPGPPIKEG